MKSEEPTLYSAEQVAELLGLHVRTVRNYVRDGRLRAVRIGKQYRIAQQDLAILTGRAAVPEPSPVARAARSAEVTTVEVTSVVQIDGIDPVTADRLSTHIVAGAQMPRDTPEPLRIQTVYDRDRARMKFVILGGASATADILHAIDALLGAENDPHA